MSGSSATYNSAALGEEMYLLADNLYPICRSITGAGFRQSLDMLAQVIPLEQYEVPSGTQVCDWTVPREWNIREAWVKDKRGERVIDFRRHNLHVMSYSVPVNRRMPLAELKAHLHTLPKHPDWIPYKTSYYAENWGFCLSHRDLEALPEGEYEVLIDSTLESGSLTYGEYVIPGETSDEVLFSCHSCHPSLANDNLSGMVLASKLAQLLSGQKLRYTYRFLFIPGTIGSITWLALHREQTRRIRHGLVVACVGDPGKLHYKRSRMGDTEIDRAVEHVLKFSGLPYKLIDFYPYGYDERQYCSPGFNLAVGSLTRTPHGQYPEYHTSADNLDLVQPEFLADSLDKYWQVVQVLEGNRKYVNTNPYCEPQLGKRGLYGAIGGRKDRQDFEMSLLWVLNLSDGEHDLLAIAERAGIPFTLINEAAQALHSAGLLAISG